MFAACLLTMAQCYCLCSDLKGTDSEPKVDFRVDESSDIPILEDRSSSSIDFPHEQWLVGNDIENIERYTECTGFLKVFLTLFLKDVCYTVVNLNNESEFQITIC